MHFELGTAVELFSLRRAGTYDCIHKCSELDAHLPFRRAGIKTRGGGGGGIAWCMSSIALPRTALARFSSVRYFCRWLFTWPRLSPSTPMCLRIADGVALSVPPSRSTLSRNWLCRSLVQRSRGRNAADCGNRPPVPGKGAGQRQRTHWNSAGFGAKFINSAKNSPKLLIDERNTNITFSWIRRQNYMHRISRTAR